MSGDPSEPTTVSADPSTRINAGVAGATSRTRAGAQTTRDAAQGRTELPDGLPTPRRYWAVLTLMSVLFISVLDSTMVNVALPSIAESLAIAPADVVRVVLAYSVTLVMTLLPFSAVAERIGFRRMFAIGITLFGLASLASALSTSLFTLMLGRIGQGLGASMLMCLFGGLVRNIYPLRKLAMGLSLNASMVGVTAVLGPTIGAWILALASWPWIFLINLPVCVLACFGIRFLPDVPRSGGRFDGVAAILSACALGLAIVGLDALGKAPMAAVLYLGASAGFAWILLRRSLPQKAPLVPIDLLRIVTVRYAVMASLLMFASQMGSFVAMPFYFLGELGYSYTELGLVLGAWSVGTALMAPVSAWFSERFSVAVLCSIGAGGLALALAIVLVLPANVAFGWYMLTMFTAGVGFGFFQTPNNRAMLTGAPRQRSGAAGGMQATTRVFGQSVGTALVAVIFSLATGWGPALGVGVGIFSALMALVVNILRMRHPASDPLVH